MVQIIPTAEYPHVYEELADYAKAEQDNNERPAFEDLGVDPFNLRPVGKGSHEPVADNKTEDGRAKNRRVEFIKK